MASLLRTKRFGWGVIFVLFTIVALLSYFSSQRYLAALRAVEHSQAVQSAVQGSLSLLKDAETGQRGYILTREQQFLEPYDSAKREIPSFLARLEQLTVTDAVEQRRLREMRELVEQKLADIDETIRLRDRSDAPVAVGLARSVHGKQIMDAIRAIAWQMLEREEGLLQQRKRAAKDAERMAFWSVGVGSAVTILLALFSLLTVHRDVQELKRTAEELAKSEEHYRLLTEQASDLVRLLTLEGGTTYVSPSVERLLGYTVAEFLALRPLALMHPEETEIGRQILLAVRDGKTEGGTSTYRLRHKSGHFLWFEVRWGVRRDAQGKALEIHTASRDVTERRDAVARLDAYAQELKSLSLRDELTALYNRRGFLEVANQTHALAIREGRPAALLFVDLNGMKRINDELGHDQGDAALVDAARVLSETLRGCDTVARLGGDEFVAFVLDVTPKHVDAVRGRLRELADIRVAEHDRPFRLSMSVGAAYLPVGSTSSIEALLDEADQAMYLQKNARRAAGDVSVAPPAR
jgi:diguanylate cyclase (GGDEF)-like protein/PAS domain S-box-containing protein